MNRVGDVTGYDSSDFLLLNMPTGVIGNAALCTDPKKNEFGATSSPSG